MRPLSEEYFKEVASDWDELRSGFFSGSVREKAIALSGARAGSTAADIGAGTGFVSEGLVGAGLRVIAVDESPEMLEEAKKKLGSGVEYKLGSAERLPLPDCEVDFAFANMLLHHVESPGVAVREMARIVKPGGKVVVTDLDRHTASFLRTEHRDRWMGFDRREVEDLFSGAGLIDVRVLGIGEECCATSEKGERAEIGIFAAVGVKPAHNTIK